MTHFTVVVMLDPNETAVEAAVEKALAPYDENDESFREGSRWDWYAIGGRWDGEMLGLDPLNITETCGVCNGTGTRDWTGLDVTPEWVAECNGCNGCKGTGRSEVWFSPEYETLERNSCLVREVAPDFVPFAFIAPDGQWYERGRMGWFAAVMPDENGKEPDEEHQWAQKWGEARGVFADRRAVLVDCHV